MRYFLALVVASVSGSVSAHAQPVSDKAPGQSVGGSELVAIDKPRLGDLRLDWCREWSQLCGKPAADEFCRRQGFLDAASFTKAPVGEHTSVIGTGQICNNPSCDSFATITCRRLAVALPTMASTETGLGRCDQGVHPEQRIAICTAFIERGGGRNETVATAYLNRCDAYAFEGQHDQALADCNKAIELNPSELHGFVTRGRIHALRRSHNLAVRDMSEAIRLKPHLAELYYNRGTVYAAAGLPDRAAEDFAEALRLEPNAAQVYISRGILYSN
ncbi:MAG: tetratricopeptide repeat protein, partial [Hyphomicrobiaceae bacterium]